VESAIPSNLAEERVEIPRLQFGIEQPPIEVAVIADCGTEGDVDVEAYHG
jgi:hypothetical protein